MKALDRKLVRDLAASKAQTASIALVIGCGLAAFVGCISAYWSLMESRDRYYEAARFSHVFAAAKRVPGTVASRLLEVPGVAEAETRVVQDAQLSIEGVEPPMVARLIGVDFARLPGMNRVTLTAGRWPAAGSRGEAVVNQRFLEARGLALGDTVRVLLNGKLEQVRLVGTGLSPEYVYPTRGTGMPDDAWFAILWVDARALAAAFDMEGAFNSAVVRLQHGASKQAAIAGLDALLEPYGAVGAVSREDQMSHKVLSQEISQQQVFGTVLPAIFLLVAAFILNVVLHRQVHAQRPEIAALKALGYADWRIALHFLGFAAAVCALGIVLGIGLGAWMGRGMVALYAGFFHFPDFAYVLPGWVVVWGSAASLAAALGGTLLAIRGVVRLRAAEAMRPPAPADFRPILLERIGLAAALSPSQRMVLRNLERRPVRALVTVAGIAGSVAILISGTFWVDSLDWFMDAQFNHVTRGDVNVGFVEAVPRAVRHDLARLPGVREVQVGRTIPARIEAGHRSHRTAVTGVAPDASLTRIMDMSLAVAEPPPGGILLSERLARKLGVAPGGAVRLHFLEGRRRVAQVRVGGTVHDMAGMNAWMRAEDLRRIAAEGDVVNSAQLLVDRAEEPRLLRRLKEAPAAAVIIVNRTLVDSFRETSARNILFFTAVLTAFAAAIAVGVVYNNARIQLAERSWELASLRVLGLTRREVSVLLLGELALEIAVAIPLGLVAGYGLAALLMALMAMEEMEFPMVILPKTYLYAAAMVAAAGVASALVVRNRIDRLDLVAVLKTRE